MRRGFTTMARSLAVEVRGELGLSPYVVFDPRALAELYGIPVYRLDELTDWGCRAETAWHFGERRQDVFSAALVPVGVGQVIVENSTQSEHRRRVSISHEMAHVLLEHPFPARPPGGSGDRGVDREIEREADCLAGELLIPAHAALLAARDGATDEQVARRFRVSVAFARMRMNRSGARTRVRHERHAQLREAMPVR